ncbi:potassium channel family protein [Hoeflea sp. WL0058]|uniref:Potassium channel family protein n=1 Tax=Flavimaribacter sediminis TaxID=2865987 RepID=A0AAE2ZQZ7_9HYPH|nr:potassium channel family protein [Flavimaribacter sediminis]
MSNAIKIRAALVSVFGIVALATVFFHYMEGWNWIDSYYFSVVTMATVGYGDFAPKTDPGKIGATILIFTGIGALAVLIRLFADQLIDMQARRIAHSAERHPHLHRY